MGESSLWKKVKILASDHAFDYERGTSRFTRERYIFSFPPEYSRLPTGNLSRQNFRIMAMTRYLVQAVATIKS